MDLELLNTMSEKKLVIRNMNMPITAAFPYSCLDPSASVRLYSHVIRRLVCP